MLAKAVGVAASFVFTWGIAFRLAYGHYRGDWLSFWIIVAAWMAFSGGALFWIFGSQPDPEGEAERKAFSDKIEAIFRDTADPHEAHAAVKALMPSEPKARVVSRWSKFWATRRAGMIRPR